MNTLKMVMLVAAAFVISMIVLAALPTDIGTPDRPIWYPAVSTLSEARCRDRQREVLQGQAGSVTSAAFSPRRGARRDRCLAA